MLRLLGQTRFNLFFIRRFRIGGVSLTFFVILTFLAISLVVFIDRENIFSVSAKTDTLSITLSKSPLNQWDISNAKIQHDPFDDEMIFLKEIDTYILLSDNTKADIVVTAQYLHITLNNSSSVGYLDSVSNTQVLGKYLEIYLPKPLFGKRILPFEGATKLGDDVAVGVTKILHSAKVSIIEEQLFQGDRYEAGSYELESGDRITFYADDKRKNLAVSKGFIMFDKLGLSYTSHGKVKLAVVDRLGSSGYVLKPSFWARIVSDPAVVAITTLLATLFLSLEFFLIIRRLITGKN